MDATTLDNIVSESIADRRFYATATVAFAIVMLLLAVAGLYGVISHGIVARTRELGVRVALGAQPRQLLRLLVAQGVRPVILGLVAGAVLAFWASTLIERFLFGVRPLDGTTYLSAITAVLVLAVAACLLPSIRAARLSPMVALRSE
jgi:ABC-type antimicrobial peptide transport system permease subunit